MKRAFKILIKFVVAFVFMTAVCTLVWQYVVHEQLYDCTDAFGFDYWQPGNWVHDQNRRPVAVVQHVAHHRSMSEPDTIKEGWSVTRLWHLWYSFIAGSLFVSIILALIPWLPRKQANKTLQATAAALCALAIATSHNAVVADASAPPAAVPELGR